MITSYDIPADKLLGVGLYGPSEAGLYAGISPGKLQRWIHGSKRDDSIVKAQFPQNRDVITFLDMVQALAIDELRRHGVSSHKIRETIQEFQRRYPELQYPFATKHEINVVTPTRDIAVRFQNNGKMEFPITTSGNHKGQLVHAGMLGEYLQKLTFGTDGFATQFTPLTQGQHRIVLDPEVRFGQPRVLPCGLLAETLYQAYQAEKSYEKVAYWYEIKSSDVHFAVEYMHQIEQRMSA